jgi:hypothetical protein
LSCGCRQLKNWPHLPQGQTHGVLWVYQLSCSTRLSSIRLVHTSIGEPWNIVTTHTPIPMECVVAVGITAVGSPSGSPKAFFSCPEVDVCCQIFDLSGGIICDSHQTVPNFWQGVEGFGTTVNETRPDIDGLELSTWSVWPQDHNAESRPIRHRLFLALDKD